MIYLDSPVALAYLLAEDRYPSNALWESLSFQAGYSNAKCGIRINARRLQAAPSETRSRSIAIPVRTLDAIHLAAIEFIRAQGVCDPGLVRSFTIAYHRQLRLTAVSNSLVEEGLTTEATPIYGHPRAVTLEDRSSPGRKEAIETHRLNEVSIPCQRLVRHQVVGGNLVRQSLADAVDLIVVASTRKAEEFGFEIVQPRCGDGKKHLAACDFARLNRHPGPFVEYRLDCNCGQPQLLKLLNESAADAGILDQDGL